MDYTLSPQHVVHPGTGQRMHDQNQPVPTQVTDKDINAVSWSLMEVIKEAGLSGVQFDPANQATYRRLLLALQTIFAAKSESSSRDGHNYTSADWLWLDRSRGLKLQYGVLSISGNGQSWMSGVASFPLAFTTECFGVWGVGRTLRSGGGLNAPGEIVLTAFGEYSGAAPATFRWRIDTNVTLSLSGSLPVVWFAIGV